MEFLGRGDPPVLKGVGKKVLPLSLRASRVRSCYAHVVRLLSIRAQAYIGRIFACGASGATSGYVRLLAGGNQVHISISSAAPSKEAIFVVLSCRPWQHRFWQLCREAQITANAAARGVYSRTRHAPRDSQPCCSYDVHRGS